MEPLDAREGRARRDAVHEEEALAVPDPLVPERRVFFLPCRVQHLEHACLAVYHGLLPVRVLNGRVVLISGGIVSTLHAGSEGGGEGDKRS